MEEWNEFGELKENIGPVPASDAAPAGGQVGVQIAPPISHNVESASATSKPVAVNKAPEQKKFDSTQAVKLPGADEIAARNKATSPSTREALSPETKTSSPLDSKVKAEESSQEAVKSHAALDHLSAPASRIHSGTATPTKSDDATSEARSKESHRGSDIVEAPAEEIKKIESQNSLKEEDEEDTEAVKGISELKVDEEKTQEQPAKDAAAAEKSVGD